MPSNLRLVNTDDVPDPHQAAVAAAWRNYQLAVAAHEIKVNRSIQASHAALIAQGEESISADELGQAWVAYEKARDDAETVYDHQDGAAL